MNQGCANTIRRVQFPPCALTVQANATGKEGQVYPTDGAIRVAAPSSGTCPVCATVHDPKDPHDRNSLYYLHRFHRRHKRFPTWADAMAHCSAETQEAWKKKLLNQGVSPEEFAEDETT